MLPISILAQGMPFASFFSTLRLQEEPEVEKVEHTASAFFDSLKLIFYGEKITIPYVFLPLMERTLATLSALGYGVALAVTIGGFGKIALVIIVLSTGTFIGSAALAQATLQESLANSAEKLEIQNDRLEKEVDRLSSLNDQLAKTAESLDQTNEDLKKTNADLQYTNQCLTGQVDRFAIENEKLATQVSLFAAQNAELRQNIENLRGEVDRFSEENNQLNASLADFRLQLADFAKQNAEARAIALQHQEQMGALIAKNETQQQISLSLLETVVARIGASETEIQALCAMAKEGQRELIEQVSTRLTTLLDGSQLALRSTELERVTLQVRRATDDLIRVQAEVTKAASALGRYEGQIERNQKFNAALEAALVNIAARLAGQADRFTELNEILSEIVAYKAAVPKD